MGGIGPIGPRGEPGVRGVEGPKGESIIGPKGDKGDRGEKGDSGESITGPPGPEGKQGPAGVQGDPGLRGLEGPKGDRGDQGEMGPIGLKGDRGDLGPQGIIGVKGDPGDIGPMGPQGIRGADGAPGKLPIVKTWTDKIHYEATVVAHKGATYQAVSDTAKEPGASDDWICISASGRDGVDGKSFNPRGPYRETDSYQRLDVAVCNGSSFVCLKDNPGPCPGDDWRLLSSAGKRGEKGERGFSGAKGDRGAPGEPGREFVAWEITDFEATPIMSDGTRGPSMPVRSWFDKYHNERG